MSFTVSKLARAHEAPLLLALAGATVAQTWLLPPILLADLVLALAAAWALALVLAEGRRLRFPRWGWVLLGLVVWAAAAAAVLAYGSPLPFSTAEFLRSFAKLCFYVGAVLCLAQVTLLVDRGRLADGILWIVAINGLVGIYVYVVMATGAPLPYEFVFEGTGRSVETAVYMRAGSPFLRLRGLAAEPSYFGYVQVLALAVALLQRPILGRGGWRLAIGVVSVLLTFALTTYALAAAAVVVVAAVHRRTLQPFLGRILIAASVCLLAVVSIPAARTSLSEMVVIRGFDVLTGKTFFRETARLEGSWQTSSALFTESPLLGAGLGNYNGAVDGVADRVDPAFLLEDNRVWNVFAYVGGSLGLPGLLLLLALVVDRWRRSWAGAVLLIVAMFADGTWLGSPFWMAFLLLGLPPGGAPALDHRASSPVAAGASPGTAGDTTRVSHSSR